MKPSKTTKNNSQFSIDMDLKGLVVFLTLVALTGATLFYLGMTYGKASRNANQKIQLPGIATTEKELTPPKDLKIYNLDGGASLQKEFDSLNLKNDPVLTQETDAVETQAKQQQQVAQEVGQLQVEPEAAPQPRSAPQPALKATKQKNHEVSWPDIVKEATSKPKGETYTIQILSTSQKSKAERMVSTLKKKGFPAYIVSINLEGRQLYRVRVAKDSREKINKLKVRMSNVVQGLGSVQIMQVR